MKSTIELMKEAEAMYLESNLLHKEERITDRNLKVQYIDAWMDGYRRAMGKKSLQQISHAKWRNRHKRTFFWMILITVVGLILRMVIGGGSFHHFHYWY